MIILTQFGICFATWHIGNQYEQKIRSDVDFRNELDDLIRLQIFC